MFKSLLRTLPSLSGNFTIACKLNKIEKEDYENYYSYVKVADMLPLQNNIYKERLELNLLNGNYVNDVNIYFNKYSSYFYKENFSYPTNNFKILNLDSLYNESNDDRNKDYEFGCKRISYSRNGYQFSFYAPIYIDSVDDLPKYFCLHIEIDDSIQKNIKIYINKDNKINYLKHYLTKYIENIDNRVIFCLPQSLQATYFGLDVKNNCLVEYKDNLFGYLYTNQIMINNFDNIICKGFERNNLIMRQIIPLSFMFNLNDIFNDYEIESFIGRKVRILGYYYSKNDCKLDVYDFDIDYFNSFNKYQKYNEYTGKYEYDNGKDNNGLINVMNVGYPALNESKYIKYEFTNKITPKYCKFKLMHSTDKDPYITNTNFAYSYLQYPNKKYGYFPTTFKGINPGLVYMNGDIKLPLGKYIDNYYVVSKYFANKVYVNDVNYNKFIKLMQNYVSSWFNLYKGETLDELCDNYKYWSDVDLGYAYFNGILYNFNVLENYDIDKFSVILKSKINKIDTNLYNEELIKAKYVYSLSDESNIYSPKFNNSYNMKKYIDESNIDTSSYYSKFFITNILNTEKNNCYLHYNKLMKKDKHGKYIKECDYIEKNTYFKISDVLDKLKNSLYAEDTYKKIQEYLLSNKISGYLLLNGNNNINYFEYYNNDIQFILESKIKDNLNIKNIYENLYYSTELSTQKYLVNANKDQLNYNSDVFGKFIVYIKNEFINLYDILFIMNEMCAIDNNEVFYNNMLNLLNEIDNRYIYEIYGNINGVTIENYFVDQKYLQHNKQIYVDSYNLDKFIKDYNKENKTKISISNIEQKNFFIDFINKDHIKEYFYKLNRNEYNKSNIELKSFIKNIYVKYRCWYINNNTIDTKDVYIDLYNYLKTKYNISINTSVNDFDWLYSNLSEVKNSNNKFELIINNQKIEVSLCFNKSVYVLDNNLFNVIYSNNELSNYLYLYIEDNCKNNNFDMLPVIDNQYISKYRKILNIKSKKDNFIIKNINDYLVPLFTDVYVNDSNKNTLFNMIQTNKINNVVNNETQNTSWGNMQSNNANSNYKYFINENNYFKEVDILSTLYDIYKSNNIIITNIYNSLSNDSSKTKNINDMIAYILINHTKVLLKLINDGLFNMSNQDNVKIHKIIRKYVLQSNISEVDKNYVINVLNGTNNLNNLKTYLETNNKYDYYINEYLIMKNINIFDINVSINDKIKYILIYLYENEIDLFYDLIEKSNIVLYSIYEDHHISLEKFNDDNVTYDNKNNLCIYKYNNLTYAFYFIDVNIDNSNFTFNILNDYNLNIVFDTINYRSVNDQDTINTFFKILYPFLNFNIFSEFAKNISTIVYQNELEILIKYQPGNYLNKNEQIKYKNYITSENDYLYNDLLEYNNIKKIKILRYFNYITPYLKKVDSIIYNNWHLQFMESNNTYNDIEKYNILGVDNINIYKYNPLKVYYDSYDINNYQFTKSYKKYQIEYKHFNDNLVYNLPEEIIIYDTKKYNLNEINIKSKDKNNLYNEKINILYKYFYKHGLDYEYIKLFLFNKYNSKFFIEKNNNYYRIKYTFNLI